MYHLGPGGAEAAGVSARPRPTRVWRSRVLGGEEFILEHKLRHAELQVCTILGREGLRLLVCPRDHDRPGCGGRGFSGGRRGHGRPSRKGGGRRYRSQGPGGGRGGGAERSRRGGNGGDRGGVQSQRLWDGGGQPKSQDWPKPGAAEQRRRHKSRDGPEPGAAVQRERQEPRNWAEPAVGQRARRGRRHGRARPPRWQ